MVREKHYYINGILHREDGPAVEYPDGTKYWYKNGKVHRFGGTAVIMPGDAESYWIDDKQVTKEQHDFLYSIMKLKGLQ